MTAVDKAPTYRCAGASCPGLPYRASVIPHPQSCIAVSTRKLVAAAYELLEGQPATVLTLDAPSPTHGASAVDRLHGAVVSELGLLLRGDPTIVDRVAAEERLFGALDELARIASRPTPDTAGPSVTSPTRGDLERLLWSDPASAAFLDDAVQILTGPAHGDEGQKYDSPDAIREVFSIVTSETDLSFESGDEDEAEELRSLACGAKRAAILMLGAAWAAEERAREIDQRQTDPGGA